MIFLALCSPFYEMYRINVTCRSIGTSETDKIVFPKKKLPRKLFTFWISVSVLSKTAAETNIIQCNFCQAKLFQIPLSQLSNCLFRPHQMSFHLRLEAMHHWKHLTGKTSTPFSSKHSIFLCKIIVAQFTSL